MPELEEIPYIKRLWADPETMRPVGGPVILSDDAIRRWYIRIVNPGNAKNLYCLIFTKDEIPIGEISFHRMDLDSMVAEFNVKVHHQHRGQGYGKDAMLVFLDYFFNQVGGKVMVDDVALDNDAGQQALLRFGFTQDLEFKDVFRLVMTKEIFNRRYQHLLG